VFHHFDYHQDCTKRKMSSFIINLTKMLRKRNLAEQQLEKEWNSYVSIKRKRISEPKELLSSTIKSPGDYDDYVDVMRISL
jgi:uncharacterized protein YifE (UPF0438 family)